MGGSHLDLQAIDTPGQHTGRTLAGSQHQEQRRDQVAIIESASALITMLGNQHGSEPNKGMATAEMTACW